MSKLLKAAHDDRLEAQEEGRVAHGGRREALWTLTVWLGLRQGEVFGLRWEDVDLVERTLTVRTQLQYRRISTISDLELEKLSPFDRERVETHRTSLKDTEQSKRQLPLPKPVVDALTAHLKAQALEQALAGRSWQGEEWGLVFCSTIGTPLDPSNVTKQCRAILKAAGIEQRRFHDLRHSCGTFPTARNVHRRVLMQILGHSQISTTMNT